MDETTTRHLPNAFPGTIFEGCVPATPPSRRDDRSLPPVRRRDDHLPHRRRTFDERQRYEVSRACDCPLWTV